MTIRHDNAWSAGWPGLPVVGTKGDGSTTFVVRPTSLRPPPLAGRRLHSGFIPPVNVSVSRVSQCG
jgi:hypothetical protein